ncbi:GAF domain-containing protein [Phyllobacterium sp. 22229]|uniref:Fis family transcriptional regulator n=1 Tax=Phyllobacterium myrsinacearum TaxID=28101 RepID=A0A2S9JFL2_9HYPH|nr:GAF domain-containing protein [Phyllobacterium myrsinacearum]PRD51707.1 Fis family transcriptional regulator [Phyllobacterium myrsinacearum]PWV86265.1 transcriptional regulator [Phyllobacterium myrsinacearum]RZS79313.1 transcriptional regulator [Phyllobacterium myrsinacearum]RZU99989.1 transcriptional regulator [Phyllobacterium myrsinacearum]
MASRYDGQHAEHIQSALLGSAAAQSALVASWGRSMRLYGLNPEEGTPPDFLSERELTDARERLGSLITTAQATLDRLYSAVGGAGCCVLLADKDGVPVDRRGSVSDDATFCKIGLWTGAVWSEEREGTNGIGTALAEQRALTIHRDQHFRSRNTALSCTVAPIFDHCGRLMAAIDVSSARHDLTEDFVKLIAMAVVDAARRVEAENFRLAFPKARIMLAKLGPDVSYERSASALIAVDEDDLVIGASRTVRHVLGLTDESLSKPLPAASLLGQSMDVEQEFAAAERSVIQRVLAKADGNISLAATMMGMGRATLHRKLKKLGIH